MDNSLSKEATDWRKGRRFRAFELKQQGWSQQHIAEALGVSKGAVSQWMKRARDGGGVEALKRQPAPGASPRLSEQQRTKLPELLERGAEAHGFRGEAWTCGRVATVIRREYGVSYHPAHVSRLLKALRHSLQRSRSAGRIRGTRRPSNTGKKRSGLPSKGGAEGKQNHSVLRSVGLLLATHGSSHLRSDRKDAHSQREPHTRSPFGDERHNPRWQALHDLSGEGVQRRGRGTLPKAPHGPNSSQAAHYLGRLSDPSRRCSQRVPRQRGSFSAATRTVALLYAPDLKAPTRGSGSTSNVWS
jgi:transposase